jgi:hypothetical protein
MNNSILAHGSYKLSRERWLLIVSIHAIYWGRSRAHVGSQTPWCCVHASGAERLPGSLRRRGLIIDCGPACLNVYITSCSYVGLEFGALCIYWLAWWMQGYLCSAPVDQGEASAWTTQQV